MKEVHFAIIMLYTSTICFVIYSVYTVIMEIASPQKRDYTFMMYFYAISGAFILCLA
jgi:hypothetical protein